jgi:hypothetical protein
MPAGRGRGAARAARRLYPIALAAWERWQRLSPEEKERYRMKAREYARRGRDAAGRRRGPPGGRPGGPFGR